MNKVVSKIALAEYSALEKAQGQNQSPLLKTAELYCTVSVLMASRSAVRCSPSQLKKEDECCLKARHEFHTQAARCIKVQHHVLY